MHSLAEFRDFLLLKNIEIKDFNGWSLKVGKDTWTMLSDVYYKNGTPQNIKQKGLFDNYKRKKENGEHQSNQTRKWRGINCRNRRGQ
jgi:hypothetical protein